jgi:hypothetical protein
MLEQERPQLLNLVVVSPGDVQLERKAIDAVVNNLNRLITRQFGLELRVHRWETDVYPAFHPEGPQGQVDETLQIDNCDIMVGIFWKKFGTPVKDAQSGTEHELERAYSAWQASNGKRPHIMIYFKDKKYDCKTKEEEEQRSKVEAYKKKVSKDALWWSYKSKPEFERYVRDHLLMYLLGHAGEFGGKSYTVIKSAKALIDYNRRIVNNAQEILFATGSRSRDAKYLETIEKKLKETPELVHYRVLFDLPYHQVLKDHLRRLVNLRRPEDRNYGLKTIYIGLYRGHLRQFETFILGNERQALVILPSFLGVGEYNSGIIFTGRDEVDGLQRFVKQLYALSEIVETIDKVEALRVLKAPVETRASEGNAST